VTVLGLAAVEAVAEDRLIAAVLLLLCAVGFLAGEFLTFVGAAVHLDALPVGVCALLAGGLEDIRFGSDCGFVLSGPILIKFYLYLLGTSELRLLVSERCQDGGVLGDLLICRFLVANHVAFRNPRISNVH
jgi:hypothetical protein